MKSDQRCRFLRVAASSNTNDNRDNQVDRPIFRKDENMTSMLLSAIEAAQTLGISERLFHELRHTERFPAPVLLSERCVRWRHDDLAKYIEALPTAAPRPEPTQLRRVRR